MWKPLCKLDSKLPFSLDLQKTQFYFKKIWNCINWFTVNNRGHYTAALADAESNNRLCWLNWVGCCIWHTFWQPVLTSGPFSARFPPSQSNVIFTYKDKYVRIIIIPSESKRQCHGNIHWWLCAMTGGLEWKQWQKEKRKRCEKALVSYFTTHWKPSKTFDSFSSFLPVR